MDDLRKIKTKFLSCNYDKREVIIMGRQVNFLCSAVDFTSVFDWIHEHDAGFFDEQGNQLIGKPEELLITDFVISYHVGLLNYMRQSPPPGSVAYYIPETIVFSVEPYIREIKYCRIWTEFSYWNDQDELVHKSEVFEKFYEGLAKMIKKKAILDTDRCGFYIMSDAYEIYKEKQLSLHYPTNRNIVPIYFQKTEKKPKGL